jgi:hemoglobin-like flavoprotein
MKSEHVYLVQRSWSELLPMQALAAPMFYHRLFELDPSLRPMFHGDLQAQGRKLVQVIDAAVSGLGRFDDLLPLIQDLGRRHVDYGVAPHHYDSVGAALIWTLARCLGSGFTPPVRLAWQDVYGVLAVTMRAAAQCARYRFAPANPASRQEQQLTEGRTP